MTLVLVANADRMMTAAEAVKDGIRVTFADGRSGVVPFSGLPEIGGRSGLRSIEVPNPYEIILVNAEGETTEIPWDFARHYCDAAYEPRVSRVAAAGRRSLGERLREARRAAGMTQTEVAKRAGVGRVTLVRIEKGEQSPRYETLEALAEVLGSVLSELPVR